MATLIEQLNRAKKITPKRISKTLFDSIRSIEKDLIVLNTEQQLFKGLDAEGKRLFNKKTKRGVYSEATEYISTNDALLGKGNKIKKAGDPYTLEYHGDFVKGFYIEIKNDKAIFSSKDEKTPLLVADYGEIFGLTDKHLKAVIQSKILPLLQKEIRKTLGI